MSCVRPGVRETNASRVCPVSVLIALDFPAFERPTNATSRPTGGGSVAVCATESSNCAF